MQENNRICAVVVTFNRPELLLECLESLLFQSRPLSAIYIVDNASSETTPKLLQAKGYLSKMPPPSVFRCWESTTWKGEKEPVAIHYLRMQENEGGAGGFHEGVKRAFELGYDWLWLMDDDGIPDRTALQHLMNKKIFGAVLCSLVVDKKNPQNLSFGLRIGKKSYYQVQQIIRFADSDNILRIHTGNFFNSVLIPREIIESVGFPDKEFFIWGDELDYLYRILKHSFPVVTVADSIHRHPSSSSHFVYWKEYYMARNSIVLIKRHKYLPYIIVPLRSLCKIFLIHALRGINTYWILKGIYDGLLNRLGKTVSPS